MPDEEAEFTRIWDTRVRAARRPSGGLTNGRVGNVLCRISFLELWILDMVGFARFAILEAVRLCMSFLAL